MDGLIRALRLALGATPPGPRVWRYRPPRILVLAPNMRAARLWAYEEEINPADMHVCTGRYGPDRLRGVGPGRDLVWVHGPPWDHRDIDELERRVAWIRGTVGLNSERHVYV